MNSPENSHESAAVGRSAGQLLRAAREAQGLHLAVLSVNLKVSVRQLEALEADRHEQLKGAAFVRALAQAVCRQLRIDPAPVLAALPQAAANPAIEPLALEARRSAVRVPTRSAGAGKGLSRQVLVLAVLMVLGAAALIWWPNSPGSEDAAGQDNQDPAQAAVPMGQASDPEVEAEPQASAAPAASAASAAWPAASLALPATSTPQPTTAAAGGMASGAQPAGFAAPQASASAASVPARASTPVAAASLPASSVAVSAALVIRLQADAWVEVRDSQGRMAVKRMVQAGETLQLSPSAPLFVYVGKADRAELSWQGKPVDLKPHAHNNEARLQIKP